MNVSPSPTSGAPAQPRGRNLIAVASGKGGVGKTWFAITLAHAIAKKGRKTLLFDGDIGLANVDIQLGLMPKNDLGSVIGGRLALSQATIHFDDGGFDIVAGRSGSGTLANLPANRVSALGGELVEMSATYDQVILDLGAGVDRTVQQLLHSARECIVVTTDEPTALTDAYAFIKLTHLECPDIKIWIVVNMVNSTREGERTYNTLLKACEGFLKISPPLAGIIRRDAKVREAIRNQVPLLVRYPNSEAAVDVGNIAEKILG